MKTRASGVLLHITSLPGAYGIGDLGPSAYRFAEFLERTGQSVWQILPLNPTHHESGNSPYFSSSALAGNPLMISPEILRDEGLISPEDLESAPSFTEGRADYEAVGSWKTGILDKAYRAFIRAADKGEFEEYVSSQSAWLDDFALFTVLSQRLSTREWIKWPAALRDRERTALERARAEYKDDIDREKFIQYVFSRQWASLRSYCNGKGIRILGDLPIYVSFDSVDVWVAPGVFKLGEDKRPYVVSGVPPDYFSETGQLWNNPVYDWEALRKSGYEWWIKRFEVTFRNFDMVRIDHFRGLVQYWEVPAGEETAMNGSWKDVPTRGFFDTLKERFPGFPVIAEDLGIITDDVREEMRHYGLPGMKVLMFAFSEDNPDHPYLPHNFSENCVVYTGTHDNNTLVGWFDSETTPEDRARIESYTGIKPRRGRINIDMIRLAMSSVARLCVLPAQDILGLGTKYRMNQPSKPSGNWEWRLRDGEFTPETEEALSAMTRLFNRFIGKE